ncbi:MAG: hypothetical protein K6G85_02875 [Eubacterium sp.]|nr:hypothetical protein [Eubacterium sp.]
MDRNEFSLRVEALKAAMHQRDFEKAVEIADDLDLRKIRDNNLLGMVADAYEANHEYNRAKDALLTAYENTNSGRQLAYRLCLISIKTKEYDEAEEFYEDFIEMAPRDTGRYILKYQMAKAKGESLEEQIKILEEYVNIDMEEKWAYELTKLYHLVGDQEKCVDMCDEISLWFSEGKYVLKALELKKKYVPLSAAQKLKYDEGKKKEIEEVSEEEVEEIPEDVIQIYPEDEKEQEEIPDDEEVLTEVFGKNLKESNAPESVEFSKFDTMEIQAVVAEGMKELDFDGENIHEGAGATKVAEGKIPFQKIEKPKESDLAFMPGQQLKVSEEGITDENPDETTAEPELVKTEIKNGDLIEIKMEPQSQEGTENEQPEDTEEETPVEESTETTTEEEPKVRKEDTAPIVENLGDVQKMLEALYKKGILKEETVKQAVNIIEEAGNEENKEIEEELARIDQGLDEEDEYQEPEVVESDETTPETEVVEEEVVPEEEPEEESEEASEETMEEQSENVVSKATVAIPNLDVIRKEIQNELPEDEATKKAAEEAAERVEIERQREEQKAQTLNHIPILDLTLDPPKRDTSADVGKAEIYENIVANSDLGNITDKIPSPEEIEQAIQAAEESEQKKQEDGLRATTSLSAEVEMISNILWNQKDGDEKQDAPEEESVQEETVVETEDTPETEQEVIPEAVEGVEEETTEESTVEGNIPEAIEEEPVSEEPEEEEVETEAPEEAENSEEEETETDLTEENPEENPEENSEENAEELEETSEEKTEENSEEETEVPEKNAEETDETIESEENKGPGITLSDEEMAVFKRYMNVEGLEESIRETVEDLIALYTPDGKSTEGNVIILGDKRTGKTTLAIEMVKLVNRKRGRRNRKLAKVNATSLNKRGFRNSLSKLIGCDLIVEHAHELGVMTISEIIDCSGMFTDDMLIVLEGDTEGMQNLLKSTPRITEVFNHVIHIREYNIKEWVEYGKRYAEEKGYVMDELASLAFYKAIDDCFGEKKGINQESVEAILDQAIARRSRKLFGAKKNEDGLIILIEKNFR